MGQADYLALGDNNAICYECGHKFKASTMVRHWKGYWTCQRCWEPREAQDFVKGIKENITPPWVQPNPTTFDAQGNIVITNPASTGFSGSTSVTATLKLDPDDGPALPATGYVGGTGTPGMTGTDLPLPVTGGSTVNLAVTATTIVVDIPWQPGGSTINSFVLTDYADVPSTATTVIINIPEGTLIDTSFSLGDGWPTGTNFVVNNHGSVTVTPTFPSNTNTIVSGQPSGTQVADPTYTVNWNITYWTTGGGGGDCLDFTLTAVDLGGGNFGFSGGGGSIAPATFKGVTIDTLQVDTVGNSTTLIITPEISQEAITAITINGVPLATADASYSTSPEAYSQWDWAGEQPFNSAGAYAVRICGNPKATGGTVTNDGAYTIHTFIDTETPGTFKVLQAPLTIDYLLVGGSGGVTLGGGGGGGGEVSYVEGYVLNATGDNTVTVGAQGSAALVNGDDTTFITTAIGGGGGGDNNGSVGASGACGGGGGLPVGPAPPADPDPVTTLGGAGTVGFSGGNGFGTAWGSAWPSGGGGGMGAPGGNAVGTTCGAGGDGIQNSITGTAVWYGGGLGGIGGDPGAADPGADGQGWDNGAAGAPNGIVIIRYLTE